MKFTPKLAGVNQDYTYDTVKEHILQEIQKELENGEDMADNLREGKDNRIKQKRPTRYIAPKIEVEGKSTEAKRMESVENAELFKKV